MKYAHAKWQVEGNFSPGQFSFKTEKQAKDYAIQKEIEGYKVEVSKLK